MKPSILSLVVLLLIVGGCKQDSKEKNDQKPEMISEDFNAMLDAYYEDGIKLNPVQATFTGDDRYDDQFPNFLDSSHVKKVKAHFEKYKAQLESFDDDDLSETEQMTKEILAWECNMNLEGMKFKKNEYMPIDQMWSVNLLMGQLASGSSAQPFETKEDYLQWVARVKGYVQWLQSAESKMREGMTQGYVLPKALVVKVLPQLKALTEANTQEHLFYSPLHKFPDSFSEADQQEITEAYQALIEDDVVPAYQSLVDFMESEYIESARETSGITGIPNGKEYYDYQIKLYTTTTMTADEIHELGLSEVARIRSEMEQIKQQVGYEGDLTSFFDYVRNNKELMPYASAEEVIANFNAIHERMKPQLEKLFDNTPKTGFEVRRTEAFREKSASAEYNPGSLDGTRPGIFYVPIPEATKYNVYSDESLFLHEAIPGHHYQVSLTQENEALPTFRKTLWYSGYGEGWALYSESLGKELGLYTDPYQYFGMLGAEMHRAIRLVVDTGMHSKGWTREEAIQYSLENEAESEAAITSEIERYMANPGQALSYKIGQLKIRELRKKAETALGDAFDIGQFHNEVLETGCIPLALLEDKINRWIETQKKA
tara:strand:+ start:8250 stop:10049 length:1800 start_codon:yes stop_codon:yes gene_type:complete